MTFLGVWWQELPKYHLKSFTSFLSVDVDGAHEGGSYVFRDVTAVPAAFNVRAL